MLRILAIVLMGLLPSPAGAENWPQWRGPHADGSAGPDANPPTMWDGASGKNVKWKVPLPGRGSATPVVWGNRVFVVAAIKTDREAKPEELPVPDPAFTKRTDAPKHFYRFVVLCLDRITGKTVWERTATEKVPHEGHHATHSYAAGSPATDGERLYVSFGSFGVYAFDLDGQLLWTRDLGRLNTRLGWGEAVTPVVHEAALVLNWDQEAASALYCLDAKTGQTRWKSDRVEKSSWNTPLIVEAGGRTQVVVNATNRIRSYNLKTGDGIWSCGGMTINAIPSPVRVGDAVVCMSGYQGKAAVAIPLASKGDLGLTGPVLWRYGRGTPYVPSPAVVDGRLYFTEANSNSLTILDGLTGKPVIDRERLPGVNTFYASPVYAGGRVYFVDRAGTTVVLKPGDSVEVLATNHLGEPVDACPVAVDKQFFLRGEKHLFCLDAK